MYIYCIIFIVLAVLAVEYEFKTIINVSFIIGVLGIFLALFIGLRDVSVSRDYAPYLETFRVVMHGGSNEGAGFLPLFEPGFSLIVIICHKVFDNNPAIAVMLVFGAVSISLKLFVFKKLSPNPLLLLFLYYSHFFFILEMTEIRYGMACSLFFLALYYYLENKNKKALFFILLSILFHSSALVYLLIFLLRKDKLNVWFYTGILIIAIVLGLAHIPLLSLIVPNVDLNLISNKLTTYADYAEKGYYEEVRFFNSLNTINVILTAFFLFIAAKNKIKDSRFIIFLKCTVISIFIYGLLIDVSSLATRTSEMFEVAFPFLLVYGAKLFPFGKFNIFFLILIAAAYFYIDLFYGKLMQPYDIIHFK